MKPRFAFFAKTDEERYAFAEAWLRHHGLSRAVYVCPENRADQVRARINYARVVTFEGITKGITVLPLHEYMAEDKSTAVIIDGAIRYNTVSSSKFGPLQRLCRSTDYRLILDIAPFYGDIRSIYFPFSYLDRQILGYQHWYAFRENNLEEALNGKVVGAHDVGLLAGKVAPHSRITFPDLMAAHRKFVECRTTLIEAVTYADKRENLFARYRSPGPIITRLADCAHGFESRLQTFQDLVSSLDGHVLVLTNLATAKNAGCARKARTAAALAGKPVTARTYYDACMDVDQFDHVVFLESPIVRGYLLLDVEARVRPDARVWHMVGDAKVDAFLSSRIRGEMSAMNEFVRALWEAQDGQET